MSTLHASFTVERTYNHSPERVFGAFEDPAQKRRWFIEGEGWTVDGYQPAFKVGATEKSRFRFKEGPQIGNDTTYHDIQKHERIVFSYSMLNQEKPFSVSLATITFTKEGKGTKLTYTEQAVFFEGGDNAKMREEGCRALFEQLAKELDTTA